MDFFPKHEKHIATTVINLHCPVCRHAGAFHGYANVPDIVWGPKNKAAAGGSMRTEYSYAGMRKCPNGDCGALMFFAYDTASETTTTFPPEVIDFDATNLPEKILNSLQEAITCHSAGAYKAAALMVRRVLEELCEDRNAAGKDLKARIGALKAVAVIPDDLLAAADELRILGNDAAHVEAKSYDNIGAEEAALAVELAKELLKAVYQYADLVARLKALKKQPS